MKPSAVSELARTVLAKSYDNPKPTPEFHEELWELCCLEHDKIAIAAPRGHAKTTAVTGSYLISMLVFRESVYALLLSDTEEQASQFIGEIKREFEDNEDLKEIFGVRGLAKDSQTDIIVDFIDGHQCRVFGRGAEQKIRGTKWLGRRPDLILCHEKGTPIYTQGRWILNNEHSTAKAWDSEGYAVTVDGHTERVSSCHQYWVKKDSNSEPEWVEVRNLEPGMLIGDGEER